VLSPARSLAGDTAASYTKQLYPVKNPPKLAGKPVSMADLDFPAALI